MSLASHNPHDLVFHHSQLGDKASMIITSPGSEYRLLANSKVLGGDFRDRVRLAPSTLDYRDRLIDEGILVECQSGLLVLRQEIKLGSPNALCTFAVGNMHDPRRVWQTRNGVTLAEYEASVEVDTPCESLAAPPETLATPAASDMAWESAIADVLGKADGAMHYSEIADEIAARGLREKLGATPHITVNSVVSSDIKSGGDTSKFVRVARGLYTLRTVSNLPENEVHLKASQSPVDQAEGDSPKTTIQAFGMFWSRENVTWRASPTLLGQQTRNSTEVDFCDQRGVYLLHDGRHTVYVGRSRERALGQRLWEHCSDRLSGRWDRFSWFGLRSVTEEGLLSADCSASASPADWITTMEALLIEALEPPQNRKRGDDFGGAEYLQVRDPEITRQERRHLFEEMYSKI